MGWGEVGAERHLLQDIGSQREQEEGAMECPNHPGLSSAIIFLDFQL